MVKITQGRAVGSAANYFPHYPLVIKSREVDHANKRNEMEWSSNLAPSLD